MSAASKGQTDINQVLHANDTLSAAKLRLSRENRKLRRALRMVRSAIQNEHELNTLSIVDTVWVSSIETAVDCIDAALER